MIGLKVIFVFFSAVLLAYLVWPQPRSIDEFADLPKSTRSTLEGDTIQVPNIKAFFSDNFRDFSTNYYKSDIQKLYGLPFPPLRLNYPPEYAFTAIKDQTQSTYLEEFVYPLKGSIYVNGLEPLTEDGKPKYPGAIKFEIGKERYFTKVTLRYYPSPLWARLGVWGGINLVFILLWRFLKRR